jgi:hypothetical protein
VRRSRVEERNGLWTPVSTYLSAALITYASKWVHLIRAWDIGAGLGYSRLLLSVSLRGHHDGSNTVT